MCIWLAFGRSLMLVCVKGQAFQPLALRELDDALCELGVVQNVM
jgi:hypothetical protein